MWGVGQKRGAARCRLGVVMVSAIVAAAVLSSGCGRLKPRADRPDADTSDAGDVAVDVAVDEAPEAFDAGDGPAGSLVAYGLAVRSSGNIVVSGSFTGSVDLGAGALQSAGGYDVIVGELSPTGGVIWNRRFGGEDRQVGGDVAINGAGNTFLAVMFSGSLSLGGDTLVADGSNLNVAVAKLDGAGNHVWSRRLDVPEASLEVGLAVDDAGDVTVAVEFGDTPNGGTSIVRLMPSGVVAWTKSYTGAFVRGMAPVASGGVVATGQLWGAADFGAGALSSAGLDDVFVFELAPTGDCAWSKRFGGYGSDEASWIAVGPAGALFVTGFFDDTLDFGDGAPLVSIRDPNRFAPSRDGFIAKLDARGGPIWSERFGDTISDQGGRAIAATDSGGAVVTGGIGTSTDFGLGALQEAAGGGFVLALDAEGHALWNGQLSFVGPSVALTPSGAALVTVTLPNAPPPPLANRTFSTLDGSAFLVEYPP